MSRLEEKLATEVRDASARQALAGFCAELLARLAKRRATTIGREQVDALAAEHGVTFDDASLPSGNVLSILEQGPDGAVEHGLVSALAVSRLVDVPTQGGERNEAFDRWVEYADWLEAETDYRVYDYVDLLLTEPLAAAFWDRLADGIIAERDASPAGAARVASRVTAVAAIDSEVARAATRRIGKHAASPIARAVAGGPRPGAQTEIKGVLSRPPRGGFLGVLRLISGLALLQGLWRMGAWALRARREATLRVTSEGLELTEALHVLGRQLRGGRTVFPLRDVAALSREVRYPRLLLLLGSAALATGLLVGGVWIVEGVWTGETYLLALGALVLLGGAALDLALNVVPRGQKKQVACRIDFASERSIRLHEVSQDEADAFLLATGERLSHGSDDDVTSAGVAPPTGEADPTPADA